MNKKYLEVKEGLMDSPTFMATPVFVVIMITVCMLRAAKLANSTKIHKKFTKLLNDIMKKAKKEGGWIVHEIDDMSGGKKPIPNAFTFGGKNLYITDSLVKLTNDRQAISILLHEVAHSTNNDVIKRSSAFILVQVLVSLNLEIGKPLDLMKSGNIKDLKIVGIFMFVTALLVATVPNYMSRRFEYRADDFAVKMGYGKELIQAFKILANAYKMNLNKSKSKFMVAVNKFTEIFKTHPDMRKRIEEARGSMKNEKIDKPKNVATKVAGIFNISADKIISAMKNKKIGH